LCDARCAFRQAAAGGVGDGGGGCDQRAMAAMGVFGIRNPEQSDETETKQKGTKLQTGVDN